MTKSYLWIGFSTAIFAGTISLSQPRSENVVSLDEIVEAHQTSVKSWNFISEMELSNCTLVVEVTVTDACQRTDLGHVRVTSTVDLREVWRMSVTDAESHNVVSISGANPDNPTAFSQEFEKCDGSISLVQNRTGFGVLLNQFASEAFRGAEVEFDGENCVTAES
ncbi:hypothetical protein [Yoonia sp. BS5-3]|uniref:Uncharacterized protein n=1 Tax=Yoonia phaeophyticola TaxID=3137369 RepID=A0ABZ2UZZ1_9RHOB